MTACWLWLFVEAPNAKLEPAEFPNSVLVEVVGVALKENDGNEDFTDELVCDVALGTSGLEPNSVLVAVSAALLSTLPKPKTGGPEVPPPTTPHAKV